MYFNNSTTTTTPSVPPSVPTELTLVIGYICIAIACIFFGIFNLPVKHYKTGDGMFFQLLVGLSIWSVSLLVNCVRGFPKFYALPMLGGFFWSTANLQTVPTIKLLGIGISQTINNLVSLVFGWAYARFGWFGIQPERPSYVGLNYAGVAVCALSVIVYFFVQVNDNSVASSKQIQGSEGSTDEGIHLLNDRDEGEEGLEFYEKLEGVKKKVFGVIVAIVGGVFFGATFAPILYVQDNYEGASKNGNDYSFSLGTGILISSMVYFIIYCVFKKNRPTIYAELMLPAFTTGWLWNIANTAYFVATTSLSQAVTFPISFSGPSVIASILGLFYKEITGSRNILVLFTAIGVTMVGIILCAVSF